MWKVLLRDVDLGEPTSFFDHVNLVCTQRDCETSKDIVDNYRNMFESRISAGATEKLPCSGKLTQTSLHGPLIWKVMQRINCVERYCEQANKTVEQLYKEELEMVCELSQVCSQIVLTCLYLSRIGGPDILWSVNKLARAVTKWTRACEKILARLMHCWSQRRMDGTLHEGHDDDITGKGIYSLTRYNLVHKIIPMS